MMKAKATMRCSLLVAAISVLCILGATGRVRAQEQSGAQGAAQDHAKPASEGAKANENHGEPKHGRKPGGNER